MTVWEETGGGVKSYGNFSNHNFFHVYWQMMMFLTDTIPTLMVMKLVDRLGFSIQQRNPSHCNYNSFYCTL